MKEKDFNLIYENLYNKYLEQYIKEIENLYKKANEDGDAENFAYNSCLKTLEEKRNNLKIVSHPFDKLYLIFSDRGSLVQDNNLNRLYIKFIQPECKKMKIEIGHDLFIDLLNEFAISISSKQVNSWFSNWNTLYRMMFELNDFSEFKIFRNCNFSEGSEIFNKYHRRLYPKSYVEAKKNTIKFLIKKEYKEHLGTFYEELKSDFINEKLTTKEDFINVLSKGSSKHDSKIYFSNFDYYSAYILRSIEFAFEQLNFTNIGKSKTIYKKSKKPFTRTDLSKSITKYNQNSSINSFDKFTILNNKINKIIDGFKPIKK